MDQELEMGTNWFVLVRQGRSTGAAFATFSANLPVTSKNTDVFASSFCLNGRSATKAGQRGLSCCPGLEDQSRGCKMLGLASGSLSQRR